MTWQSFKQAWLIRFWSPVPAVIAAGILSTYYFGITGTFWAVTGEFTRWGGQLLQLLGVHSEQWGYYQLIHLEGSPLTRIDGRMIIGMFGGCLAAALWANNVKLRLPRSRIRIAQAVAGGIIAGFGARLAMGCNLAAFFTGIPQFSLHAWLFAIATAIGSLKGPRHGAANQRAHAMVKDIQTHVQHWNDDGEVADYLRKILAGEAFDRSGLIYGMGHAVYTLSDPRAELLKDKAAALAKETGFEAQYDLLDRITRMTKEILRERKGPDFNICPNIDLYTGLIYEMMGIQAELFTPLFATARVAGWSAHRLEQVMDSKIMRPGYFYLDANDLTYAPLDERPEL